MNEEYKKKLQEYINSLNIKHPETPQLKQGLSRDVQEGINSSVKEKQLGENLKSASFLLKDIASAGLSALWPVGGVILGLGDATVSTLQGNPITGTIQAGAEALPYGLGKAAKPVMKIQNTVLDKITKLTKAEEDFIPTIRLYRGNIRNGKFNVNSAANGEKQKQFAGMWFSSDPNKIASYLNNYTKGKFGVKDGLEIQYVDIPEDQLSKYSAGNNPIIKKSLQEWDFEPEDYLIPKNIKRTSIPIEPGKNLLELTKKVNNIIKNLPKAVKPSENTTLYNIKEAINKYIPITKVRNYTDLTKIQLDPQEKFLVDDYIFDSREIKTNPSKIESLDKIIRKNNGKRMDLVRRDNITLDENSVYEPKTPLSFSLGDNLPRYGKDRLLVTTVPKQSFLASGLNFPHFIPEQEIVLPSNLKYKILSKIKNDFGGFDYKLKILNPNLFIPGIISLNLLNNNNESK